MQLKDTTDTLVGRQALSLSERLGKGKFCEGRGFMMLTRPEDDCTANVHA